MNKGSKSLALADSGSQKGRGRGQRKWTTRPQTSQTSTPEVPVGLELEETGYRKLAERSGAGCLAPSDAQANKPATPPSACRR
jgi:hypothetical protein